MLRTRVFLLPVLLLWPLAAQVDLSSQAPPTENREPGTPDGRSQKEALAKTAYRESLDDTKKLMAAVEQLKVELEKNDRYVVSMTAIRKTEEIEKLAKRIRARLKQ